jgi:hypothetical protein
MSVISGILNSQASQSAANTQADAATNSAQLAADTEMKMFNAGLAETAPWKEAGKNALTSLVNKVNAGPGSYRTDPGYQFRVSEGEKAINNSAAARGGAKSGATSKALTKFGQDYATGDYQNFLANYYASLNPLQSVAGVGQTVASQSQAGGNQVGANIGNQTVSAGNTAGNALATGLINKTNAITGSMNSGANNYLLWKYLNNTPGGAGTTPWVDNSVAGAGGEGGLGAEAYELA